MMHLLTGLVPVPQEPLGYVTRQVKIMMHLLIGLGPCPLGALRVCYQADKNNDASTYRVGSLSPRSP